MYATDGVLDIDSQEVQLVTSQSLSNADSNPSLYKSDLLKNGTSTPAKGSVKKGVSKTIKMDAEHK